MNNLDLKTLYRRTLEQINKAKQYSIPAFIILLAIVYGFVLLRISTLQSAQPSDNEVASQVNAAQVPKIDEQTVNQLRSLQDNSVSVETLFNNARNNPF